MSEKKKYSFLAVLAILLVLSAVLGGTVAYLTKNLESRANNFTLSSVDIDLVEENWDNLDSDDKVVYPNRIITKDPKVVNTGANNLYVYIEVKIPRENIRTVNGDGSVNAKTQQDIVTFTVNDGWEEIATTVSDDDKYTIKTYAYTAGVLAPKNETNSLFNEVTFVNMLEGELEKGYEFEMPINAYAIQSDYLEVSGDTFKDKIINAFDEYKEAEQNQ